MADEIAPSDTQQSIELDNGVVLSGMGGDLEALRIAFEERAEERGGEPVEAVPEPAQAATEPVQASTEKSPRGPKRYAQLTKEREDAHRERDAEKTRADAAEARARELEARLNAPVAPVPAREPVTAVQEPKTAARPKPVEAEIGTKYAQYADFIEDLADWKAEQRMVEAISKFDTLSKDRIEADRASRSQADLANTAFARGREAYPDFDAVLNTPDVVKILIPPDHQRAILAVPDPEHVMYELAKHPAKLQEIVAINDGVKLGIALAMLVPRAAVASPASTAPVVRTTQVPAPPQPVVASTRTTSPSSEELALKGGDDFDASGYREKRARELGRSPVR